MTINVIVRRAGAPPADEKPMRLRDVVAYRLADPEDVTAALGRLFEYLCEKRLLTVEEALELVPLVVNTARGGVVAGGLFEVVQVPEPAPRFLTSLDRTLQEAFPDRDDALRLDTRIWNCLSNLRCQTLRELIALPPHELMRLRGFGQASALKLAGRVARLGLHLGTTKSQLENLDRSVGELALSVRADNMLTGPLNCTWLADVVALSEADLLKARHSGKRVRREITEALAGFHLRLRDSTS